MKNKLRTILGIALGIVCFSAPLVAQASETMEFGHPQLSVEGYEIVEGSLEVNTDCTMRIYIKNLDSDNDVIAGSVTMYSSNFYPVTGTDNQRYFGVVKPGEEIYVDYELNLNNLTYGPNPVELLVAWTDEDYEDYANSVNLSPVVLNDVGFEIKSVNIPQTIYGGDLTILNVSYENTGDEELSNLSVVIEGDVAEPVEIPEIEDLNPGQEAMEEFELQLSNEGVNTVSVSFTYEDRNGNSYTTEPVEVTAEVVKTIVAEEQEVSLKAVFMEYRIYFIAGAVAVLLTIPFIVGRIVKAAKKAKKKTTRKGKK